MTLQYRRGKEGGGEESNGSHYRQLLHLINRQKLILEALLRANYRLLISSPGSSPLAAFSRYLAWLCIPCYNSTLIQKKKKKPIGPPCRVFRVIFKSKQLEYLLYCKAMSGLWISSTSKLAFPKIGHENSQKRVVFLLAFDSFELVVDRTTHKLLGAKNWRIMGFVGMHSGFGFGFDKFKSKSHRSGSLY